MEYFCGSDASFLNFLLSVKPLFGFGRKEADLLSKMR